MTPPTRLFVDIINVSRGLPPYICVESLGPPVTRKGWPQGLTGEGEVPDPGQTNPLTVYVYPRQPPGLTTTSPHLWSRREVLRDGVGSRYPHNLRELHKSVVEVQNCSPCRHCCGYSTILGTNGCQNFLSRTLLRTFQEWITLGSCTLSEVCATDNIILVSGRMWK